VKSKVKYAVLILVIGLLGLAILASPVFGGGPKSYEYHIIIEIDGQTVTEFYAYGNKNRTRIVGYEKYQMGYVPVSMNFPPSVVEQLYLAQPERPLYWSPLEDLYGDYCYFENEDEDNLQDLNSNNDNEWE